MTMNSIDYSVDYSTIVVVVVLVIAVQESLLLTMRRRRTMVFVQLLSIVFLRQLFQIMTMNLNSTLMKQSKQLHYYLHVNMMMVLMMSTNWPSMPNEDTTC